MGSAGCGTSYTRWQNVRSPSTDHDVHPARRCGNESRQRGGLGLPGSGLTGTTGSSRQNIADHPRVCGSFLVEASQSRELRSARTRVRETGPSMESLRSCSQLKFFPETAVSWRRRWQKNTNFNFMAETCHQGRCSRRSFGSPQLSRLPPSRLLFPVDFS